ncbi:MAG: hypothetical protein AAF800_10845 [Planctomycetota bacterium]
MPDRPLSDDDLLANAIPIDLSEEDESSGGADELTPIDISQDPADGNTNQQSKIQVFGEAQRKAHADHWNRTPNATGSGAIHVKTFVAKLRHDAIDHLDEQVNTWLDAHPEYEVKFVTTSVGKLVGKISEDALFMNVWV